MLSIIVGTIITEIIVAALLFRNNLWRLYGLGLILWIILVVGSGSSLIPLSVNMQNLAIAVLMVWIEVYAVGLQWRARTRQSRRNVITGFMSTVIYGLMILVYLIVVFSVPQ